MDSIQAVVPSMGDSITEGTIAGILKAPGDAVAEDEAIAQIETDKVTIDVRAPKAGSIIDILVKDDDTVTVGQTIANIEAGGKPAPAAEKKADKPKKAAKESKAAAKEAPPADTDSKAQHSQPEPQQQQSAPAPAGYTPRIRFPPRRTADGTRISSLSIAEAERALAELEGTAGGGGGGAGEQQQQQPAEQAPAAPAGSGPQLSGVSAALARKPAVRAGDSSVPGRRTLTEREMEIIELGGAPP